MARNRLTWQNVAAPDYGSSMQGHALASRMFQNALGGLSDSLGSFTTQQKATEQDALLKQQQAAEGAFLRQMAAASGDTAAQAELRRTLGNNTQVGNEFLGDQLTAFRNAALTGDTSAENLNQTRFDNLITQRDQGARDAVAPLQAEMLRQEQLGNKGEVARLQKEYFAAIAGMNLGDQRQFFEGNMGQRKDADGLVTAALGRSQTQQSMNHAAQNQGWKGDDRRNKETVESLRLIGMAAGTDPAQWRAAMIKAASEAGLPASVLTQALQQDVGQTGGGSTRGGSPAGSPPQQRTSPQGDGRLLDESDRVLQVIASRTAAEEGPNETILGALADDAPMAAQYERQKQQYPSVFENLTLDEYSKLFEETSRNNKGLPRGAIAELMLDNFTRGTTTWDRLPRWIDPLRIMQKTGNFASPDFGRTAGIDQEAVSQAAQVLNTQLGRNTTRDTHQKLNNAAARVKSGQDGVNQASAQIEAALQHYQQWGNPNVLIEAQRNYELAEMDLSQLIEGFKKDEALSELFVDPDNPARTITPQESRKRQDEVDRTTAETTQNRAFAAATIPAVQERINQLQQELREAQIETGTDFLAPVESIERVDKLRKALEEENRRLRQLRERLQ